MGNKMAKKIPYILMILMGIAIAVLLFAVLPSRYRLNRTVELEESGELLANPLIGFAPPAENEDACEETQLVYIGLTWAEWEPREGEYALDDLEEKYHIAQWKAEGKHAVLRFICDIPGEEAHKDIPEWLYQKTRDGSWYDTEYGQGYSPDYENTIFREAHASAIAALAVYCNESDFVAYVELGSLGHWGEWHISSEIDAVDMPDTEICWEYVLDYSDQFSNALLLMRRNYEMVADAGLGLYNDMAGDTDATSEWLAWISAGGVQPTDGEDLALIPLEATFWQRAPVGGELTSGILMENLLGENLSETLRMAEESHMTFLGPNCPTGALADTDGARELQKRLGYRFYISQLETRYSFLNSQLYVSLTWENTGSAPLYWDWPVTMYVYDMDGELQYWEGLELNLSELMPGGKTVVEAHIPYSDLIQEGYQIGIGITSPYNKEETLKLAMDAQEIDGIQIIDVFER
ncbi:MAG: DUF4832 domain-containing protein [Lachnospiraceae bacterium]|nr:DUF4832 domain-containing protein [Lachnospiraceae bacterium]